jgi:hypothetical protein
VNLWMLAEDTYENIDEALNLIDDAAGDMSGVGTMNRVLIVLLCFGFDAGLAPSFLAYCR